VPGREPIVSLVGEAESALAEESEPCFTSFGFGNGSIVVAEVPGRELERSLPLWRLSGRLKGSSRLGGIAKSCESGSAEDADVEGRAVCGRDSAGSKDSKAAVAGSAVAEDHCSFKCDGSSDGGGISVAVRGGIISSSAASRMASSVDM